MTTKLITANEKRIITDLTKGCRKYNKGKKTVNKGNISFKINNTLMYFNMGNFLLTSVYRNDANIPEDVSYCNGADNEIFTKEFTGNLKNNEIKFISNSVPQDLKHYTYTDDDITKMKALKVPNDCPFVCISGKTVKQIITALESLEGKNVRMIFSENDIKFTFSEDDIITFSYSLNDSEKLSGHKKSNITEDILSDYDIILLTLFFKTLIVEDNMKVKLFFNTNTPSNCQPITGISKPANNQSMVVSSLAPVIVDE